MSCATREDRRDYERLECKNISLEEFAKKRRKAEIINNRAIQEYEQNLKMVNENINNIVLQKRPQFMPGCVPRCIIIDGANIMHCGSIYKDNRENAQSHSIPDVAALLSLIRFFVVQDFDVFTVISRKYVSPDVTNFKAGIDELIKNDLCVITPTSNLDDVVALEFAAQVNGIVLTSDLYRDHSNSSERYARIVSQNRLNTVWSSPLPKESRNTQTRQGGHYIANKKFKFVHDNGMELNTEEAMYIFYTYPDDMFYEISRERLELSHIEKKKNARIALLNRLIMEGMSVCAQNAVEIMTKPVHDRAQLAENSEMEQSTTQSEDDENEW